MKNRQTGHRTPLLPFALKLGFFAGLIWGFVKIVLYYLGFTKVLPGFLAEPFFLHDFIASWEGHLTGWVWFIFFSLAAGLLYVLLLRKRKGPWPGIGYGIAWWLLLYLAVGPFTGMMLPIYRLDASSIITDFCLFLLWGVFIGYTAAVEYTEERLREPFREG